MRRIYFLILVLAALGFSMVSAAEEGVCVNQGVSQISPGSVGLDEEFTVGIQLVNCGNVIAKNLSFFLTRISPNIIVKEDKISYIPTMGCYLCRKQLLFHMRTSENALPGEYLVETELAYSGNGEARFIEKSNFTIDVISNRAEMNIASVKLDPLLPKANEPVTLTIKVENFGKGKANSVFGSVNLPFKGTRESFIGKLNAGEDGTFIFNIVPERSGTFNYELKVEYKDDYGEHQLVQNLEMTVFRGSWSVLFWIVLLISLIVVSILTAISLKKKIHK